MISLQREMLCKIDIEETSMYINNKFYFHDMLALGRLTPCTAYSVETSIHNKQVKLFLQIKFQCQVLNSHIVH